MFWLKILSDFIKIFREGQDPKQVAWGFALGSIVGLSPILTLQGLLVWILIFILNVNLAAAFLAFTVFSIFAYLLDPIFHWIGFQVLTQIQNLSGLWTDMYNAPIAPLTIFNNTVVIGSFLCALVLFVPVYFLMKYFIVQYRKHIGAKVEKWKVFKIMKQSSLVKWYEKVRDLGGLR